MNNSVIHKFSDFVVNMFVDYFKADILDSYDNFQWYKQNRELKRKSTALVQKVMQVAPQAVLEVEDETDSNNEQDEVEDLRRSIQG